MLIGLGTGVEVGMIVDVARGAGGKDVAVGADIVVLRTSGVDKTVAAVGISGADVVQEVIRKANARIGKTNLFKVASSLFQISVLHESWENYRFLVCVASARPPHTPKIGLLQDVS